MSISETASLFPSRNHFAQLTTTFSTFSIIVTVTNEFFFETSPSTCTFRPLGFDRARGLLAGLACPCCRVDGCKVEFASKSPSFLLLLPYFNGGARFGGVAQLLALDSCRAERSCALDGRGLGGILMAVLVFAFDLTAATSFLGPRRRWRGLCGRGRGRRNSLYTWRHVFCLDLAKRLLA